MNSRMWIAIAWLLVAGWQIVCSDFDIILRSNLPDINAVTQSESRGLYDADPSHIWNRLHRHFHVRVAPTGEEFGEDEIDPLLWLETKYLLTGPSHEKALRLLDEFMEKRAERLINDPLKRAVFQHDLWAVFDWLVRTSHTYPVERRELASKLARVIRSLALTRDQINQMPDNYAAAVASKAFAERYDPDRSEQAFLPPDMFNARGSWVAINSFGEPIALSHAHTFSHSSFSIFISLPAGREATISYLKKLWEFPQPFVLDRMFPDEQRAKLNPDLPQLPYGAKLALVRKMLLIDDRGDIVPSNFTESVQMRVFHAPSRVDYPTEPDFAGDQDFFVFKMSRRKLFAGESGGLRAVQKGEKEFIVFSSHGYDMFEQSIEQALWRRMPVTLHSCAACHRNQGIHSVLIAGKMLKPNSFRNYFHPQSEPHAAAEWKRRRYDWGLMQGLWQSSAR